jgi:hypothetical protein
MLSRIVQWGAAFSLMILFAAKADAATVYLPFLTPGDSAPLNADTEYNGSGFHTTGNNSDIFAFTYSALPNLNPTSYSTTNITLGGSGYSNLNVSWIWVDGATTIINAINGLGGIGGQIPASLPLLGAGTYFLVFDWVVPNGTAGLYTFKIQTPFVENNTQLPLPPALLLFGSALAGLTVLGRRKRQGAAV